MAKNNKKLYIDIYDRICGYIRDNNLKSGDRLPTEKEMCEHFGVSRTIIREAIKSLEITGVIKSRPGFGIEICELNAEFMMSSIINNLQLFNDYNVTEYIDDLRCILELSLLNEVFNSIDTYDIENLEIRMNQMKEEGAVQIKKKSKKFGVKFAEADARFHQILYTHIENKLVKSIIYFSWAYDREYNVLLDNEDYIENTIRKHEMILKALKDRNFKAFNDAMTYHFKYNYKA